MKRSAREVDLTVAEAQALFNEFARMTWMGGLLLTLRLHTAPLDAGERTPAHRPP